MPYMYNVFMDYISQRSERVFAVLRGLGLTDDDIVRLFLLPKSMIIQQLDQLTQSQN